MNESQFVRIEQRLDNWGQWSRAGCGGVGHCASAEHRYVAEKLGEDEQAVHRIPQALNVVDAELVENAVTTLKCRHARAFLIMAFIERCSRSTLERKFRLHSNLYLGYRVRVAEMVATQLAAMEVKLIRRGQPLWAGVARIARGRV
jgi:hypothetical protein